MDDSSKNHAPFLIASHFIFVCQYRRKLLLPAGKVVNGMSGKNVLVGVTDSSASLVVMPERRPFVTPLPIKVKR